MIETEMRRRWLGCGPLVRLIPAERVSVGWVPTEVRPYCAITLERSEVDHQTSSGTEIVDHEVRFNIVSDELATADRIALEIGRCFNRRDFATSNGRCLFARRAHASRRRVEDGCWSAVEAYQVKIQGKVSGG